MARKHSILALGRHGLKPIGKQTEDDAGNPVQHFEARLLRPGEFKHPSADWELSIDQARIGDYKTAAEKMLKAGVSIPVTSKHFTKDAKDTLGQIESVDVDSDGWLTAKVEFVGEDAILAASRNHVSVEIEEQVKDGDGIDYGEAITSVALTPRPVVKGQKRIAAAHDSGRKARVYFFHDGDPQMDILNELGGLFGIDDLTEANWQDRLKPSIEAATSAPDLQKRLDTATKSATELQAKLDASGKKPDVDPDTLEETADNVQLMIDNLVDTGKYVPAVAAALTDELIGPEGDRNIYALSMKAAKSVGRTKPYAKAILKALALNDPVKLGEQTKRQTLALSRNAPDDDEGDAKAGQERTQEIIDTANKGAGAQTAIAV